MGLGDLVAALRPGIRPAELTAHLASGATVPAMPLVSPFAPLHSLAHVADPFFSEHLSRADAMGVPAVARLRHILCGTVAQVPLRAYRGETLLSEQPAWIASTNTALPALHRMAWTVDDLLFHGWSCWSRTNGADGRPVQLDRIGMGRWQVNGDGHVTVDGVLVDQRSVLLIPGPHEGLLVFAQDAIRHARDLQRAAGQAARTPAAHLALKQTGGTPLLYDSEDPNQVTIRSLLADWRTARNGDNGGVAYLPQGLDAEELGTFDTHLLVEGRNAAAVDIARAGSLPADLLDAAGETSMTYANARDNDARGVQYGSGFYMSAIAAALSQDSVLPHGTTVRFDTQDWLGDPIPTQPPATPAQARPTPEASA